MAETENSLDVSIDAFERELQQCVAMVIARYRNMDQANAHPGIDPAVVRDWFNEPLPQNGLATDILLRGVDETVMAHPVMNIGTKMFAYVMSGGTQVSIMADMLASALTQNVAKWHLSPAMTEIERRVIEWTADFIGLPQHHAGAIVSSGSGANLAGLTIARNIFAERFGVRRKGLYGLKPLIIYGSEQTHASVGKAIELLGLGSDNYRSVSVREDFTVDFDDLTQQINQDRDAGLTPFCLIGNAGTVNTGAIDPLAELADIAKKNAMWFHVDGAYGGLAASLAHKRGLYAGIENADSIALDYHKWLYQPYEVGCTLVKDWEILRRTYYKSAAYLEYGIDEEHFDVSRHHFDLSRNAKAFKVWMSFKAYGAERLAAMIAKDIALSEHLVRSIEAAPDLELFTSSDLGIVCFRYVDIGAEDVNDFTQRLLQALEADGRVFITGTVLHETHVLRACLINHRLASKDVDYLCAVVREVARSMRNCG